jgi:hypothetical protein
METAANEIAIGDLISALAESQVECEQLKEELALTGDELARRKALVNEFIEAWQSGRSTLKKSFWARLFS